MIVVSVCLPSNALSQRLPFYLGFSYLGRGVSFHGCSSKVQLLLLTLDVGWLLSAAPPNSCRAATAPNQSILKEISPGYSLEGLMLKLKLQYFGHLMRKADSFEKTLMLGKIEGRRRRGQ